MAEQKRRPVTQAREAGPGMPESAQLPAKVEHGGRDITDMTVAQQAAALATTKWGKLLNLPQEMQELLYAAIHSNFPALGAVELEKGFCILGDSIYDTAEFWLNRMAGEDRCVGKPECRPIEPGTPEWKHWMRDQDPKAIAAASICRVEKLEADGSERSYEEANYCAVDDEMLFGLTWVPVPDAKNGQEAMRMALAGNVPDAPDGGTPDRVFNDKDSGFYKVRFRYRYPDYIALARMIADTRATRRVGKRAFPMVAAQMQFVQEQIKAIIEQQVAIDEYQKKQRAAVREARAEDPYATPQEVEQKAQEQIERLEPDHVTHPEDVRQRPVEEKDVRRLYSLLEERVGGDAHQTLKRFLVDARGLAADDPVVLEGVNPHHMTMGEWVAINGMIEQLPKREDKEPVEEAVVLVVYECPNCRSRDEAPPGLAPPCSAGCGAVMQEEAQGQLPLD